MMLSVFLFSIYPLLASIGLEKNDPIAFIFMTHLGCTVFSFICGGWMLKKKHASLASLLKLDRKTRLLVFATGTAAAINHACLMFAFLKTSKVGATIIYETWPIIALWLTPILVVKGWEQVRRMDYIFGSLAVIGIAFIISADARDAVLHLDLAVLKNADPDKMTGYALAFVASIGVCISTMLRRRVTKTLKEKYKGDLLLATYLSSGLTRMAALPVIAVIFFMLHQSGAKVFAIETLPLALFTGIAVHLLGTVFYVFSLLKNPNPSIPVPDFLAPIMAVFWLYAFGHSGVTDFAIIGGLFVITANLLVTVRAEDGFAYTASILTLLLSGVYCYLTAGTPLENFYDAISVSAVFYAILIAFAWDRVLERTKVEEALLLDIAYGIEALRLDHKKGDVKLFRALVADIKTVIATTDRTVIGEAYKKLLEIRGKFGAGQGTHNLFQRLDSLILSKTKDIMLSEVVLLCLIGGVTFFGILGYRPPGLWPDMMACIMAGAIVFIFFAIFDQMTARNKNLLSGDADSLCIINPDQFQSRHEYKLVTIVLIAIMLAVFYGLFAFKYKAGL